jgi:hypothetical protein
MVIVSPESSPPERILGLSNTEEMRKQGFIGFEFTIQISSACSVILATEIFDTCDDFWGTTTQSPFVSFAFIRG